MKYAKSIGVVLLILAGMGLVALGQPTFDEKIAGQEPELLEELAGRSPFIDPGELFDLMHNNRSWLVLIDVRDEADFNVFHLINAKRFTVEQCSGGTPAEAIKVVMSNDEARASEAWKHLKAGGCENVYILEGGINLWLDIYRKGDADALPRVRTDGLEPMRHAFDAAYGANHPAANPDPRGAPERSFERKVKLAAPTRVEGGGCG